MPLFCPRCGDLLKGVDVCSKCQLQAVTSDISSAFQVAHENELTNALSPRYVVPKLPSVLPPPLTIPPPPQVSVVTTIDEPLFSPSNVHKLKKCSVCSEMIVGPKLVRCNDVFHESCLTCKVCRIQISEHDVVKVLEKAAYHDHCATSLRICHQCHESIVGKGTKLGDTWFHKKCATCISCKTVLDAATAILSTGICYECHNATNQSTSIENLVNEQAPVAATVPVLDAIESATSYVEALVATSNDEKSSIECSEEVALDQPEISEGIIHQAEVSDGLIDQPESADGKIDQPEFPRGKLDQPEVPDGKIEQPEVPEGKIVQPEVPEVPEVPGGNIDQPEFPAGKINQPEVPEGLIDTSVDVKSPCLPDVDHAMVWPLSKEKYSSDLPESIEIYEKEEDPMNPIQEEKNCFECKKKILDEAIEAENKYYHLNCLNCIECNKNIQEIDKGYIFYEKKFYHIKCYENIFFKFCIGCSKVIHGTGIVANGTNSIFHPSCFRCTHCMTELSRNYFLFHGQITCNSCNIKLSSALHVPYTSQAIYSFQRMDESQLTIHSGDDLIILSAEKNGWSIAQLDDCIGYIPNGYFIR